MNRLLVSSSLFIQLFFTVVFAQNAVKIEQTFMPETKDIQKLIEQIHFDEAGDTAEALASPFGLFIRDEHQEIIAGCSGLISEGSVYIDYLWVALEYRRHGYGTLLMEQVDALGRSCGCHVAALDTFDGGLVETFYKKLGYVCDFVRFGYVGGNCCYFLHKDISE